jgi:DNA-binding NtrC family response regulator
VTKNLSHSLRDIAQRLPGDDAQVLWRAANQLESFQEGMGECDKSEPAATLQQARDIGERKRLLAVLIEVRGNRTWAADRLRISRTALYKVLRKHGLKPPNTR